MAKPRFSRSGRRRRQGQWQAPFWASPQVLTTGTQLVWFLQHLIPAGSVAGVVNLGAVELTKLSAEFDFMSPGNLSAGTLNQMTVGVGMYVADYETDQSAGTGSRVFSGRSTLNRVGTPGINDAERDDWLHLSTFTKMVVPAGSGTATYGNRHAVKHSGPIFVDEGKALVIVMDLIGPATSTFSVLPFVRFKQVRVD
jgi:hypothetical protein